MFFLSILIAALASGGPAKCGTERWDVKTGADSGAVAIESLFPTATTIEALRALTPPADLRHFKGRVDGVETRSWVVDATLVLFKSETDSDYHLVLRDKQGRTMIAEIPKPTCVSNASPYAGAIALTRAKFEKHFHGQKKAKDLNVHVKVTGIGFFDFIHGQTGVAPNGIEIHPVLQIEFDKHK